MKIGSAPRISFLTGISLAAIALASLALAPQRALAQHAAGGHSTGGHFGGGHVGGGRSSGGSHGSTSSHSTATAQAASSAHVTTPPVSTSSSSGAGAAASTSARNSLGASVSTLSSSGVPPGLAMFAEPGTARGAGSSATRSNVTLGFPVSGANSWQPSTGQARVRSFSGQGRNLWQDSSGAIAGAGSIATFGAPAGASTRSQIFPARPGLGLRHFRNRFPIFGRGGFGFFGPGFGFFGFNDGFGFGNGFGCNSFWNSGWGCNGFDWGNGWGPGYGFGAYYPIGAYDQSDSQDDTSRIYGPYAWQNPPESDSGAQSSVSVSESPTLIYLKDGTSYAVTNYWLGDSKLHYVTTYGGENAIAVNDLDFQRTVDENAQRGVAFTLKPAPGAPMQSATPDPAGSPAQNAPPDSAAPLTPPAGTP